MSAKQKNKIRNNSLTLGCQHFPLFFFFEDEIEGLDCQALSLMFAKKQKGLNKVRFNLIPSIFSELN